MSTGGNPARGGNSEEAGLWVFAPERGLLSIAGLGTLLDGSGSTMYLRDRQGQNRILLQLDADGNPSIEMRDSNGNVTWRAQ